MALARIGIGSNVGDAAANVRTAFERLGELGTVTARSSLYRTKAWGVIDQADFWNAAALLNTALEPHELLRELKRLESDMGRVTTFRWGPRVIDLDILAYDDLALAEPDLTIPHPRLRERAFALAPLAEIDAAFAADYAALDAAARAEAVRAEPAAPVPER
jgi:2-amino-4-hydroxy-6-hydroxymethyldihydropteridine diphosphokinase